MSEKPDVSVLMPTYNDEKYISISVESLQNQSYKNWELIVVDGSNDATPHIVRELAKRDKRIKYLREQRSGQLNALLHGSGFVQGKYVTLLHSDDELSDTKAFERNVTALKESRCDGVYGDLISMDAKSRIQGRARTANSLNASSPAILFLRGGSNLIPDFFFVTKEAFGNVLSTYITWNMPYWLRFNETGVNALRLRKIEQWYKYRVYSENYIRSEVGRFETANGCLRTVLEISQRISIPFLKLQRTLARVLKAHTKPLFKKTRSSPQDLREMAMYVLDSYLKGTPMNAYIGGLKGFYSNFPSNRTITLEVEKDTGTFLGKDARLFFHLMEKKSLPAVYECVLEEATKGFGKVAVKDRDDRDKARNMMRFLNLLVRVEVA